MSRFVRNLKSKVWCRARHVPVSQWLTQEMPLQVVRDFRLQMSAVLSPLIQELVELLEFDKQMFGRSDFRYSPGQRALWVLQVSWRIGRTTTAAIVTWLIFGSAFRTCATHKTVSKKRPRDRVVKLLDILFFDQSGFADYGPESFTPFPVLRTVRAAVIVKFNLKTGEVPNVRLTHIRNDNFFWAALTTGSNHNGRAVRVVGTHKNAPLAA